MPDTNSPGNKKRRNREVQRAAKVVTRSKRQKTYHRKLWKPPMKAHPGAQDSRWQQKFSERMVFDEDAANELTQDWRSPTMKLRAAVKNAQQAATHLQFSNMLFESVGGRSTSAMITVDGDCGPQFEQRITGKVAFT